MANRDHPIRIEEGDTVILASSLIPGNETAVYRVVNGLMRWGARVIHRDNALVHVSGHASAGELLYVFNLVRPRNLMPVHGEPRHLLACADLAVMTGVPRDRIVMAEDGVVVDLVDGVARIVGVVPWLCLRRRALCRRHHGVVPEDRRILGDEGFVSVFVVVDSQTGKIVGGPEIQARGSGIEDAAFDEVVERIQQVLNDMAAEGSLDLHQIQQRVRRTVGRWVNDRYRRRPIVPVVVEV